MAVKDIILKILHDTYADSEANALLDQDLLEHCKSQGLTDIDVIETELYSLIEKRLICYVDEGDGMLTFWLP